MIYRKDHIPKGAAHNRRPGFAMSLPSTTQVIRPAAPQMSVLG